MAVMNTRLIRLVCLAWGVLLALPPAWCCYAWQRPAAPAAKPAHAPCCHKKEAPRPAPSCPTPPAQCPWCDERTAAPTKPEKFSDTPALPSLVSLAAVDTPRTAP